MELGFESDRAEFLLGPRLLILPLTAVDHIGVAGAVWADAGDLKRRAQGPVLTGPFFWTAATLLGGVFVAGIYWLMHHSTLSRQP
jgi:hypothetical protein